MELIYELLEKIPFSFLQYDFMKNALLAVLFLAPLFALLGTMAVNNNMAFFSDALGHSALTGIGIGAVLGLREPLLCMIAFGIFLSIAITKVKCADRLSSDSIISVFSSTAMALGIVILSQQGGFAKYSYYLIGDILTITQKDLYLIIITLIICYIVWILLYNDLLLVSINRSFAVSRGINAVFTENVFVILVAITVMISIKWLGILTINSLLILPAAAARNISRNAKSYHIITMFIAWIACLGGLLFSYEWGTSAGASIVLIAAVIFFITFFISANSAI
ncbi:MAG: metal ABC transporter permease [Firmicutes bacterium]|jgi:zinc transport system permease protein|nr:metal ABC transporter permease [Bacillota bacterium]